MKLNRENYFSKEAEQLYLGSTSFKNWDIKSDGCEAREVAILKGEWQKQDCDAFLIGSYVHAWSSGDLKDFMQNNPRLFKKDETLYAKYEIADKMISALQNDVLINKFRTHKSTHHEQIFTGNIDNVNFKIQVDMLNLELGYFADLKTTKDLNQTYYNISKKEKESFIEKYDYFTQIAIYSYILKQALNLKNYLQPYIIVVDKTNQPDKAVIDMGTDWIDAKIEVIKSRLFRITEVRKDVLKPIGCGKCDYCKSIQQSKVISFNEYKNNLI